MKQSSNRSRIFAKYTLLKIKKKIKQIDPPFKRNIALNLTVAKKI